jgi:hypothetical protein
VLRPALERALRTQPGVGLAQDVAQDTKES